MNNPSGRDGHLFQFSAKDISEAATEEADYHTERVSYWRSEYDRAVARVEETISAKIVKHPVTDGYNVQVTVDYGDTTAYERMQEAFRKIHKHRSLAEQFAADASVYGSQGERVYELTRDDVRWFRLGGEARDEDETVEALEYA